MSVRLHVEPADDAPFDRDFEAPEVVIGRAPTANLVIADSSVSRHHARLVFRDDAWWVEDMGARNRTTVNGEPLAAPRALRAGDRMQVGGTILRFVGDPAAVLESTGRQTGSGHVVTDWTAPDLGTGAADDDRQAARMRTLNEIHRALAAPISLPELLDLILERCFDVLRPQEGVILLRTADGGLSRAASRRIAGSEGEVFVPRRIVDEVAGKSKPALVLDAAIDERFAGSDSIMVSGIRSIVAAPLVDAEGTIGLITLCSRASVKQFSEQDLDMLVSIASAAALRVRNVALADEAAARRVLEHELSLAHEMQMAMLPRRVPQRPEVAVAAMLKPARSVGGDLYDFDLDGDRLWFIVADVAGKSVAAALYMAVAKTLFRATARGNADLAGAVSRMNEELARDNDRLMFVTAAVGYLDLTNGDLAIVDAGHNPAMIAGPDGRLATPSVTKCVALGVVEDFPFTVSRLRLERGATLVLYTDGMTDARNTAGEMFGAERLEASMAAAATDPPKAFVEKVIADVEAFASGAPPEDDLTLLALRYVGA
jgi:phosphoserine phosphatase RsbU/P